MEVKLSHRRPSLAFPNQATIFPSHSFYFKRHFGGPSKKWRLQIQEESNGQNPSKNLLIHVVKEGENLTSISKQYGVSVNSIIEENTSIVDVDLVFQGQQLKIPSSAAEEIRATEKNKLSIFYLRETHRRSLKIFNRLLDKKYFTMQIARSLPHAKPTTGYFLVLVPLLAFCIRCMIGAFRTRVAGDSRHQAVNESKGHHRGSKSMRWKSALSDITEADIPEHESRLDSNDSSEDQAQTSFEDTSLAYSKLEHDYEKFLSECGLSKWGYWRGGSPE
ncbi:hypothetical protein ACOSQ3_009352 [Xanthoceras sorbifolium]